MCLAGDDGNLRVWFRTETGLQMMVPSAVPARDGLRDDGPQESGSEFDAVWLLLPERDNPVRSREFVYTGITRAQQRLTMLGPEAMMRLAVQRVIRRVSALCARLAAP